MNREQSSIEIGNVKLIEYSDPAFTYDDKLFLQSGIAGFYVNKKELEQIAAVINYYLNIDMYQDVRIKVGGEYVAT
jgi:hypothetical protein